MEQPGLVPLPANIADIHVAKQPCFMWEQRQHLGRGQVSPNDLKQYQTYSVLRQGRFLAEHQGESVIADSRSNGAMRITSDGAEPLWHRREVDHAIAHEGNWVVISDGRVCLQDRGCRPCACVGHSLTNDGLLVFCDSGDGVSSNALLIGGNKFVERKQFLTPPRDQVAKSTYPTLPRDVTLRTCWNGEIYGFTPEEFGKLEGGRWRSLAKHNFRGMEELVGVDAFGRAFLRGRGQFWVLNPRGNDDQQAVKLHFEEHFHASEVVLGDIGALWCLSGVPTSDASMLEDIAFPRHAGAQHALLRIYNDRAEVILKLPGRFAAPQTSIVPGREGGVIIARGGPDQATWIVEDNVPQRFNSLFDAAENAYDLLRRVAPNASAKPLQISSRPKNAFLCQLGDFLFVSEGGRSEPFHHGNSMQLDRRLRLLESAGSWRAIAGPITRQPLQMIVLSGQRGLYKTEYSMENAHLVTLRDLGVRIEPCPIPEKLPSGPTNPASMRTPLLVDQGAEGVYCTSVAHRTIFFGREGYQRLPKEAGRPLFLTKDGRLILQADDDSSPMGYRVWDGMSLCNILVSFTRRMAIIRQLEDGRLLASAPGKVMWLKADNNGSFTLDVEEQLDSDDLVIADAPYISDSWILAAIGRRLRLYSRSK